MRSAYLTLLVFLLLPYSAASFAGGLVSSDIYIEVQLYPSVYQGATEKSTLEGSRLTQSVEQTFDSVKRYIPDQCVSILVSQSMASNTLSSKKGQTCQSKSKIFEMIQDAKLSKLTIAPI